MAGVTGAAGLSLTTGPHRLTIDGAAFRTWCAYDSIGIAAALAANAKIETECAVCGRTIRIRTHGGQPPAERPERLWLASGGSSLRGDFCDPTVLLCSVQHAAEWAEDQQGRGRAVDLIEASTLGAAGWASCAHTAAQVRAQSSTHLIP
jgi:Alkylmercury lyase